MAPHFDSTATLSGTPLTIGWIEGVLKNSANGFEPKLVDWSAEKIGVGQGFCSNIFRVKLTWDGDDANGHNLPTSVVVKVPTPTKILAGMDEVAKDGNMSSMTDESKEKMNDLWLPLGHSNETISLAFLNSFDDENFAVPKLYKSQEYRKEEPGHGCLIMEDFARSCPPNVIDGLSKVQLLQVTRTLAIIQAASLNQDEQLSKLISMPDDFIKTFSAVIEGAAQQYHMMAPDLGFDELFPKVNWIFEVETILSIIKYADNKGLPKVLTHGDLWASNLLVEKDEEGKPTGDISSLIDWQTAHAGFVVEDLGRLLVTSTTGELRRELTDTILQSYFDHFRDNLAKRGKTCPLTVETIKDAYDFNFPLAVAFFLMTAPLMLTSPLFADHTGKPAPHCVHALMSRAKMAIEDVIELKRLGRC
jgi:hypothetical protein